MQEFYRRHSSSTCWTL